MNELYDKVYLFWFIALILTLSQDDEVCKKVEEESLQKVSLQERRGLISFVDYY